MKKDEVFERWFRENFYSKGKPQVFIPIYRNVLDFKNYCKMAWYKMDWETSKKTKTTTKK